MKERKQFSKLLRYRLDERNRRLIERFTEEKQRHSARGLLNSSETVRAMHSVLEAELKTSADVVITTAMDVISRSDSLVSEKQLQVLCSNALLQRKDEIEELFLLGIRPIEEGLLNKAMLKPYMSLGTLYGLQRKELLVNLSYAYVDYTRGRGGNLMEIIKNRFLDHPVIAWTAIAIVTISTIVTLVDALVTPLEILGGSDETEAVPGPTD